MALNRAWPSSRADSPQDRFAWAVSRPRDAWAAASCSRSSPRRPGANAQPSGTRASPPEPGQEGPPGPVRLAAAGMTKGGVEVEPAGERAEGLAAECVGEPGEVDTTDVEPPVLRRRLAGGGIGGRPVGVAAVQVE